ncbi:hypothetical protein ACHQM5_022490 [Ranunculus cassubicifolius]
MDTDNVVNVEEDTDVLVNKEMLSPPTRSFHSRDELLQYVRNFSISQGYATTIRDSKTDKYVTIGCDRGGTYRNRMNTSMEDRKRKTSSRLIDCPFRIKGIKVDGGSWVIQTKNGTHNHEASRDMAGHPSACHLSNEEILRVNEMSKSGATPSQALTSLVQANPELKATNKTIYNVKAKIRKEELAGRTPIQALMDELSTGGFKYDYKRDADNRLTHLFFSHPSSITLSRSYPNVFVMDCTYKTNRFKMPLLDVIGVSSFNTSFYSCFGFLSKEEEEDYIWALMMFKKVLGTHEPTVIVSDRELALMNAIRVVFPRTTNLLCTWHVEKNISANCKKHFEEGSDWETFILCWTGVIQSDSESLFNEAWKELEGAYKEKVIVINYVRKTWLPFRQHFVKAWTDFHLHFGNRVSSRAEGAHAKLKKYLKLSTNNLLVPSERICLAVDNTFREIKAQLARENIRIPHSICCPFFKEIAYRVSVFALQKLLQQYKLASSPSPLQPCKGHFTSTMGLPCAHMIRNMSNRVLRLSDIHSQWRIDVRSFEDGCITDNGKDKFKLLLQELENKYLEWPITRK